MVQGQGHKGQCQGQQGQGRRSRSQGYSQSCLGSFVPHRLARGATCGRCHFFIILGLIKRGTSNRERVI